MNDTIWQAFATRCNLTNQQLEQFKIYYKLLLEAQEAFNVTTITGLEDVIAYHFEDSLALEKINLPSNSTGIVDVGSGAGFPGIPLKIKHPELPVILIEVTQKKVQFLNSVIAILKLNDISCYTEDWRTFLRTTHYPIDTICARASLQPEELVRMFKSSSPYKNAQLVYWASQHWQPSQSIAPYITEKIPYTVGEKKRLLIVMKESSHEGKNNP